MWKKPCNPNIKGRLVTVFDLNFMTGFLHTLSISEWKGVEHARRTEVLPIVKTKNALV